MALTSILLEFGIGLVIGIIGGGVIITLIAVFINMASEMSYKHKLDDEIKRHNRYIEKRYKEFMKLQQKFLEIKKKLTKQVENMEEK